MARNPGGAEEFPQLPSIPLGPFQGEERKAVEDFNAATEDYYRKLNGRISLGTRESLDTEKRIWSGHVDGELLSFAVPAANVDFAVPHNLERVPIGFWAVDMTSASPLYRLDSTPAHTTRLLYMRTAAVAGSRFTIFAF